MARFGSVCSESLGDIVRRMWSSDMYADYGGRGCPSNDKEFVKKHGGSRGCA
jgi:hypothetical protein